jgi:hypothetical protein
VAHPFHHVLSSVRKHGGQPEDDQAIHDWFDQTKAHLPDARHRVILHSSFEIFLCEQIFGATITNSDGKVILCGRGVHNSRPSIRTSWAVSRRSVSIIARSFFVRGTPERAKDHTGVFRCGRNPGWLHGVRVGIFDCNRRSHTAINAPGITPCGMSLDWLERARAEHHHAVECRHCFVQHEFCVFRGLVCAATDHFFRIAAFAVIHALEG